MKTLIIGNGEIGKSLFNVLNEQYDTSIKGVDDLELDGVDIIHICFPYSDEFVEQVKAYQKEYKPQYTVIHSTVPVGTTLKCNAIHSPCVGIHPHLEQSMKTFIKFLGGEQASEVADYFRRAGMRVQICDKSETTELAKIASTTLYALMIEYVKELKKICDKDNLPFSEVYTLWTQNYNEGYKKLGYPEYKKPILQPIMKKQGGHCTLQNCELWDNEFTKLIKKLNK